MDYIGEEKPGHGLSRSVAAADCWLSEAPVSSQSGDGSLAWRGNANRVTHLHKPPLHHIPEHLARGRKAEGGGGGRPGFIPPPDGRGH